MKKWMMLVVIVWLAAGEHSLALEGGLGVCHWAGPNGLGLGESTVNWFYAAGGGFDWAKIEAKQGVYDFSEGDNMLASQLATWPKASYWLDVQTGMVASVPEWTKNDVYGYVTISSKRSAFIPWNENYLVALDKLLGQVRKHYDDPTSVAYKFRDKLTAINMMGGGPNGEMLTGGGGSNYNVNMFPGYTDQLYIQTVMRIVDMYVKHFGDFKPVVLQLGNGLLLNGNVFNPVVDQVSSKYGNKVWLKWNGWNEVTNAVLPVYKMKNGGRWTAVNGQKMAMRFTNNEARNIIQAKTKIKSVETISSNMKMVIYKDNNGQIGNKWAESNNTKVSQSGEWQMWTFSFPASSLYMSYSYWVSIEGIGQELREIEVIDDGLGQMAIDSGEGWKYQTGSVFNWETSQIFRGGLSYHQKLASVANITKVGFEPGGFGTASQAEPVQNPASVIYEALLYTVDSEKMDAINTNQRSNFYVPISFMCLQNDYYQRAGITADQYKRIADLIRINAAKPLVVAQGAGLDKMVGDANGDGRVDLIDLGIWKTEFVTETGKTADFYGDGKVDLNDFGVWKSAYLTNQSV
ncbi:MAG: dockerin type I domain-containing protein [Candidatus Shapirobacteria bacterium]